MKSIPCALCALVLGIPLAGCGSSDTSTSPFKEYKVVGSDGAPPTATVGDALRLSVLEMRADGSSSPVSSDAQIAWSGAPTIEALPQGSSPDSSILPQAGDSPAAMWVKNPTHLADEELNGVLFVLGAGSGSTPSIDVTAAITGGSAPDGSAIAHVSVAPFPNGDATRGQSLYGANCASCHGAHGEGDAAPGLNDEPDHVAGDPDWTPQLLGIVSRDNMDDQGVSLDPSMPKWLTRQGSNGKLLTTQDFSDIYAFLKTQHGEGPQP